MPPHSALNILLFDKLNTPLNAQSVVRDQVLQFLREAHPDTRIAIFSLTTELKLLRDSHPTLSCCVRWSPERREARELRR